MLTQADFENVLVANLVDAEIIERYQFGDPLVVQQLRANAAYLALLAQEIDVATIEPFIKARDRSIMADATNKGILPVATACQHQLIVKNTGTTPVTLSSGRVIEDTQGGRPWRLLSSITVAAGQEGEVLVEQSELRQESYTIPITQSFHRKILSITDGLFLAAITVRKDSAPLQRAVRWMNATADSYVITTDDLRRFTLEFGDSDRVGTTAQEGEVYTFDLIETYGEVDSSRLKDAALQSINSNAEQAIGLRFGALVRNGASPLSVAQLRVLASYPALYDENAVFLGNFDYLIRQKFMSRCNYLAVWNETVEERAYGVVSVANINHLHCAIAAKNPTEDAALRQEIALLIGRVDSLYDGRLINRLAEEIPYSLTITARLAAVHDTEAVTNQIKGLLVDKYGKGSLAASRWLPDGFNLQELATLLRANVSAFQDRISDFSLTGSAIVAKPHQWQYLTTDSIAVNIVRTADTGGALWVI